MSETLLMLGAMTLALAVWIASWSGIGNEFLPYLLAGAVLMLGSGLAFSYF